jgi:50S ribosomal protein L16 3-hydroxylase
VPDARLDDVMISYASDGGGVGPHFDSYDVFLLQAHGQRRWRYGRQKDMSLVPGMPLKILSNFVPEFDEVLNPGDMLYLPPRYAHDGVAVGECMTYSIGFRSPNRGELARELLQRLAEDACDLAGEAIYRDPLQGAVPNPGAIPAALHDFSHDAMLATLKDPDAFSCVLGEYLSEPKASVWFEAGVAHAGFGSVVLDRRTRMMYDARHIFINGEGFRASGRDAVLMHRLADERALDGAALAGASVDARTLLLGWLQAGWAHERV